MRHSFTTVRAGSPAERAGLAPGDEPVAINELKLTARNLSVRLAEYRAGDEVTLSVFRRDELMRLRVTLGEAPLDTCYLQLDADAGAEHVGARERWLSA
jgi:predicted metalloprotease with PDZ domain